MKICFVGHDVAPSRCFSKLAAALRGYLPSTETVEVLGYGRSITATPDYIINAVKSSDLVIIGMSSSPTFAEMEVMAGEWAKEAGVKYGFYSDAPFAIYRAMGRAWFNKLASEASLVIGLMDEHVSMIFPAAKCVATGNPLREDMMFPTITRRQSREKLGIYDSTTVIHAVGGKFAAGNMATWVLLFEAVIRLPYRAQVILVATPHPGDPMLRAFESVVKGILQPYEELFRRAPDCIRAKFVPQSTMTTSEVLAGADLVVEFAGSASVEAAYHRIPVIAPAFEINYKNFMAETGTGDVETIELGTSFPVRDYDAAIMSGAIEEFLNTTSPKREKLIARQAEKFPILSSKGAVIEAMVAAIESL